jgi:hypothetical protein
MARRWTAVLARLGTPTGDRRILAPGGITSRDLPLPLMWQSRTEDGHGGSSVIGRIETIRFGDDMVTATGSLLDSAEWSDAMEQIEAGVVGPSVDLDDIEYQLDDQENIVITRARIAGATLVPIPAFEGVSLTLEPRPAEPTGDAQYLEYASDLATFAASVRSTVADPIRPPAEWFAAPDVDRLTPLTVSDSGRVFGHIAGWDTCHVGLPGCVTPPSSASGYASFHTGEQRTAEGGSIAVGTLVTGPRHAAPELTFRAAAQHYDDVGAAVAKVVAGEDKHGIWVAGWLLPGADPAKVETFMSSAVSGDWRRVGGNLELIAVCSVNAPGFPVPRSKVALALGVQNSLIASIGSLPVRGEVPVRESVPVPAVDDGLSLWEWARLVTED